MLPPRQVLEREATRIPTWLKGLRDPDPFPRKDFFGARTVYYPASSVDGQPLRLFGGSRAAYCFVFADYGFGGLTRDRVREQLADPGHPGHPRGYRPLLVRDLTEQELRPGGWETHVSPDRVRHDWATRQPKGGPYALWAVLERREEFLEDHGVARMAIVFVGGEGIATFDALFCQGDVEPPFAVVLQDHGFGGNWTRFGGQESLLWGLARLYARPKWLLIGRGTVPWPGYECVSSADIGGMNRLPRRLYQASPNTKERRRRGCIAR